MKSIILILLFFPLTAVSQDYSSAYKEGYKKGYCFEDSSCNPPRSPRAPRAKSGFKSYEDGYNRGFSDGKAAKKQSNQNSKTSYDLPKFERNYGSNSSGAYSNPTVVIDNSDAVVANAATDAAANIANALISSSKKKVNNVITPLKVNLNAFKYIVFSSLEKEGGISTSGFIIKKVKKNLIKKGFNVVDISNNKIQKNDLIPNDLSEDPSIGLYANFYVKNNFGTSIEVKLDLYDSNKDLVFEKYSVNSMSGTVANKICSELLMEMHSYNPNLEKYLPLVLTEDQKIANQQAKEREKEVALNEIKRLKELFDLELISKDEFEKKSKKFKKIILED